MPRPHPPEFRRRAVELARLREKPVAEIARDLGISDSCLRNWMAQADIDNGARAGLSSDGRAELVALRRKNRVLELEVEILKRASAYFARENVLPKNDLPFIVDRCADLPVAACCRTMKVSRSAPVGAAVDAAGNVYVADFSNWRIRKIN
jgi:transposase